MIHLEPSTMSDTITCPHCGRAVAPQARFCGDCGVDLALAAVTAELALIGLDDVPVSAPIAPEVLVPRMGETMIERGLLQPADLDRALEHQAACAASGAPILLGQALLELGLVDRVSLDQVITLQILKLQTALSTANRELEQRVREHSRDLRQALDRLAELNHLKSNFIANVSHELRTPLTHIKGYLDVFDEEVLGPLTPSQKDALQVMQRAELRLETLINDLIEFSVAARGDMSMNWRVVCLDPLVLKAVERLEGKAQLGNVTINVSLTHPSPLVRADEEKIGWVILQLLDNAIKFTPCGGQVDVSLACQAGQAKLAFRDSGIGIPIERVSEIFEPFHQLDSSSSRHYGGTGLGLALVRRIVEAHGAQIQVASEPGRGSVFEIIIPVINA